MDPEAVDISIVIPTYNEKSRIGRTLDAYTAYFDKSGMSYEIIVADYSNDGSKELITAYAREHDSVKLLDITGRGKGLAVYEGFRASRGRLVSFTDADNAVTPEEFQSIIDAIAGYDAAIGSRGMGKSKVVHHHQSLTRIIGSIFLDLIFVRLLFNLKISDTQCGAKVFKREKLLRILPSMRITNSIFDVELLWRFNQVGKIIEVPVVWIDDEYSHFRWTEIVGEAIWLIRVRAGL